MAIGPVPSEVVLELDAPAVWPSEPLAGNPASGGESSCHPLAVTRGDYVGARVLLRKHSSLPEIKGDRLIDCYSIADSEASLWFSMIIVAIM